MYVPGVTSDTVIGQIKKILKNNKKFEFKCTKKKHYYCLYASCIVPTQKQGNFYNV